MISFLQVRGSPLFFFLVLSFFTACNAKTRQQREADADSIGRESVEKKPVLDVGTRLLYLVKLSDKVRFNLEAEVTMMSPEFRFSFYMNNMDFTFGAVHVSREAMEKASGLKLLFEDGLTELKNATALRISDKAYENIVTLRKTLLNVQESEDEWFYFVENEECALELDGEAFHATCMLLRNDNETSELKICRNVNHPVIFYAKTKEKLALELLQWHNPPESRDKRKKEDFP